MPMYNLIECSGNYSDTSGSLWGFKRDEIVNNADVTNDYNAPLFKYKAGLIGNNDKNGRKYGVRIAAPLKYLSNFWRSLEMLLINCKTKLSLNWIKRCMLTVANTATFKITDATLYASVVTLSTEENVKLSKLLIEGFNKSIYWNDHKVIDKRTVEISNANREEHIRELLDSSCQGVKRLFILAYDNTAGR